MLPRAAVGECAKYIKLRFNPNLGNQKFSRSNPVDPAQHLIWTPVQVPATLLLIHLPANESGKTSRIGLKCFGPYTHLADLEEDPGSWPPLGPVLAVAAI